MAEMKGVTELAEDLGLEAHIVRTKLRQAGIEKTDGKYQWNAKDYAAIVKQLNGKASAKAEDEKPAKGKKGGKTLKKAEDAAPENKAAKGKVRPKPAGSK